MKRKYAIVTSDALKVMYDRSLSISHAAVSDAAYYTCVAANIAGKDEGSTLLNVGSKQFSYCIVRFSLFQLSCLF